MAYYFFKYFRWLLDVSNCSRCWGTMVNKGTVLNIECHIVANMAEHRVQDRDLHGVALVLWKGRFVMITSILYSSAWLSRLR